MNGAQRLMHVRKEAAVLIQQGPAWRVWGGVNAGLDVESDEADLVKGT